MMSVLGGTMISGIIFLAKDKAGQTGTTHTPVIIIFSVAASLSLAFQYVVSGDFHLGKNSDVIYCLFHDACSTKAQRRCTALLTRLSPMIYWR